MEKRKAERDGEGDGIPIGPVQGPAPPPPPPPPTDESLSAAQMSELAKKAGVRLSKLEKMDKSELMSLWREFDKTRIKVPAISLKIVKDDKTKTKTQKEATPATSKSKSPSRTSGGKEIKSTKSEATICTWLLQTEGSDPVWRRLTDIANEEVNSTYEAVVIAGEGGWTQKAEVKKNANPPGGFGGGFSFGGNNKTQNIFDSDTPPDVHLTLKLDNGSKIAITFLKNKSEEGSDAMALSESGQSCAMRRVVQKASMDPLAREWSLLSMRYQPVVGGLRPKGVLDVIRKASDSIGVNCNQ